MKMLPSRLLIAAIAALALLSGCAAPSPQASSAFTAAAPRSILIVPAVNKSLDVDAPNYVLTTLPIPLAEKGYYVFPVNTSKVVLEQEGMYEAERVHDQQAAELIKMFDADAILYVTINRWDAQYMLIVTTVTVEFDYRIVGRDGAEIWKEKIQMQYQPQNNNNSGAHPLSMLLSAAVSAALTRAAPNYIPLAQQAHRRAFNAGRNPIPDGPYKLSQKK